MTRAPDIFLDVASNVLQLLPPSASRVAGSLNRFTNPFLTEDEHHTQTNVPMGPLILQARPATSQTTATPPAATTTVTTTPTPEQNSQTRSTRLTTATTTTNTTCTTCDSVGELAERLLFDLLDFLLINDDTNPKRLLSKSTVLRILAELIRSYANVAKLVSTKTYSLQDNQTCSALSYILEYLLPSLNNQQMDYDKDIPALCRLFLVAMAACNHCLESQMNLVNEVKVSLNKILILPECDEKHMRLQALANIINTMIESCPAPNTSAPQQGQHRIPQLIINNMIKIMYKRGLINDLAKMIHSIELSSPKLADTVNAVLKPMETLSRAINYATSLHVPAASRPHTARHPSTATTTTNTSTVPPPTTTDSTIPAQEQTTLTNAEQPITTIDSTRSVEQQRQQQQTSTDSTLVSTNNENRSSMDSTNINPNNNNNNASLNSASQVLLSISQEELLNATDMEPVAGLPQDVDIFERNIHGAGRLSTDEEDDDDEDGEEASMEDEDEDEDGAVGTINVEFNVGHPMDDTHEHGKF
jgi:E3 ubiquitin-protein ligase HUWE1